MRSGGNFNLFSHQNKEECYKRPSVIEVEMGGIFQELSRKTHSGYIFRGSPSYKLMLNHISVASEHILSEKVKNSSELPIYVLDIGAGDFSFKEFNDKKYEGLVKTVGLAANDVFRSPQFKRQPDEAEIFANAEYVSRIVGENKFIYIFGFNTYVHFADPVGSAVEAYRALNYGGTMLIDAFHVRGCEAYTAAIIEYLKQQGYKVTAGECHNIIDNFIIRKTEDKPELEFPVQFAQIKKKKVYYKANTALEICKSKMLDLNELAYEKDREMLLKQASLEMDPHLIESAHDLPALLASQQYKELNGNLQYMSILAMAAKMLDYKKYRELKKYCIKAAKQGELTAEFMDFYVLIKQSSRSLIFNLTSDLHFCAYQNNSAYTLEEGRACQFSLILLVAVEDILRIGKSARTKMELAEMDLPFEEHEDKYYKDITSLVEFGEVFSARNSSGF